MALLRVEAPLIYFLINFLWNTVVVAMALILVCLAAIAAVYLYKRVALA